MTADFLAVIRSKADQAASAADDTGEVVTVRKDEWFALLDAIYEAEEDDGSISREEPRE